MNDLSLAALAREMASTRGIEIVSAHLCLPQEGGDGLAHVVYVEYRLPNSSSAQKRRQAGSPGQSPEEVLTGLLSSL